MLNGDLKIALNLLATACLNHADAAMDARFEVKPRVAWPNVQSTEKQITHSPEGHILTNAGVWSHDSQWLVYDTRSDQAGERFDGVRIEMVNVLSGEVKQLYRARHGAHCGVASFNPRRNEVVFILGPEHPTKDWQYCPWHRQGVLVETAHPGVIRNLDACDLLPPFSAGALRGGSHVHIWDAGGQWVSFTYEDDVLARFKEETPERQINLRNVGVSIPGLPVGVPPTHPRNHDGQYFSVLVTRTRANPEPGSDEVKRAFEESWVGTNGYRRSDGSWQKHALAFQGLVVTKTGETISEVFIVDLPQDLTVAGDGPLAGTEMLRPFPPGGTTQRRLTYTASRKYPGIQGPRHWLRSSPDGQRIAFLMKDDSGVAQLWTVSPNGGPPSQVSHNPTPIASSFTWSPIGNEIAHAMDNSICLTSIEDGATHTLTPRSPDSQAPRPEACVFSPDGNNIAFVRRTPTGKAWFNQIWVVPVPKR